VPKGGGHSFGKFSYGDSDSIVVDLRKLNSLMINKAEMTAMLGSGWLVGPLAWTLWKDAKAFTGVGICPTVGISGIGTGGGHGFFHRQIGLVTDSILEMNIVTADGQLRIVNNETHSDLYWALRGGVASNFGIVTKFVFKVYQAPPTVFYKKLTFSTNQFLPVFKTWQRIVKTAPRTVTFYMAARMRTGTIELAMADSSGTGLNSEKTEKKFPKPISVFYKAFSYLEFILFAAKNHSGAEVTNETKLEVPSDLGKINRNSMVPVSYQSKSFYAPKRLGPDQLRRYGEVFKSMPTINVTFGYESYGGAINDLAVNETGFVHRGSTLYLATLSYVNPNPNNSTQNVIADRKIQEYFDSTKSIFNHTESYQNYVDPELTNYLYRYFGTNLQRLIQVKRKYDPENFFHVEQSIPTRMGKSF